MPLEKAPFMKKMKSPAKAHRARRKTLDLRRKAERLLAQRPQDLRKIPPEDIQVLFQELQVHQIELEMQNDELRKAQEEIEESRARFVDIFDFAPIPYFTFDRNGTILEVNFKGAELLGMERQALIDGPFTHFIIPGDRDKFRKHSHDTLRQASRQRCELTVVRKDRTVMSVILESISGKDSKGDVTQVRSALLDISELREKDEKIRAERAFRETIENSIRLGLAAFDYEGRHIYANPTFYRMVGWSREELIGTKPPFPYWPREERRAITDAFLEVLSHQEPRHQQYELRFQHRNGRRFDGLVIFSELVDMEGKSLGWLASVGDISERKRQEEEIRRLNAELEEKVRRRTADLEEKIASLNRAESELQKLNEELTRKNLQLEASNRELEAYSSTVSHDLKNPLVVIGNVTARLIKKYGEEIDVKGKEYLQTLHHTSGRMTELVDDLLELSRVSIASLKIERVDLSSLAESLLAEQRENDPARNLECAVAPGVVCRGDQRLLRSVMDNLLTNAWKFTRDCDPARIEFGVLGEDEDPVYFVRDNGCGFDVPKDMIQVFRPFQRYHSQEEYPGTGIGLATVNRIIARHGGKVWLESARGKGTTVYFTIPGV
jgi:PAS domain S-box-containing protein